MSTRDMPTEKWYRSKTGCLVTDALFLSLKFYQGINFYR